VHQLGAGGGTVIVKGVCCGVRSLLEGCKGLKRTEARGYLEVAKNGGLLCNGELLTTEADCLIFYSLIQR
jgi:hypothetical protein